MRFLLVTFLLVASVCCAICGPMPLTAKEIGLMLRSGYSSEAVMRELSARHFADSFDSTVEKQLVQSGANQSLIDALRRGTYNLSSSEMAATKEKLADKEQRKVLAAEPSGAKPPFKTIACVAFLVSFWWTVAAKSFPTATAPKEISVRRQFSLISTKSSAARAKARLRNGREFVAKVLWAGGLTEHATFNIRRCELPRRSSRSCGQTCATVFRGNSDFRTLSRRYFFDCTRSPNENRVIDPAWHSRVAGALFSGSARGVAGSLRDLEFHLAGNQH